MKIFQSCKSRNAIKIECLESCKKVSKDKAQCITCKTYIKTPCGGTTTLRKNLVIKYNLTHLTLHTNPRIEKTIQCHADEKFVWII